MSFRRLAVAGAVLALAACQSPRSAQPAPATSQTSQPQNPQAPVAKVGGSVITAGDLDKKIATELAQLEEKHKQEMYELRREALEQMIQEQVFETKAKAEKLTPEELLKREVFSKIPDPSDAQVQDFYDQVKKANPGRPLPPLPQVREKVVAAIKNRQAEQLGGAYYAQLRKEMGVEVLLPAYMPPKVEVAATGPAMGPADAPITIVEFSDYQCPFCVKAEATVKQVLAAYPGKIRLVYRDYPLPIHALAPKAAEAAHCAGDQGKYWEMHDRLFAANGQLAPADLKGYAKELGLDASKFDQCLDTGAKTAEVASHRDAGNAAGVNGTPAFFINGHLISGAQPFDEFKRVIDEVLAEGQKSAQK